MRKRIRAAALSFAIVTLISAPVALVGCTQPGPATPVVSAPTSARAAADQVVAAIKGQDGAALSAFVSPEKGLRFSPYAFVDVKKDVVLTGDQVAGLWDSTKVYTWGAADGTGDPIKLTPSKYAEKYIFDRDFSAATSVTENSDTDRGNTVNNAATVYPNGTRIEYYIEATLVDGKPADDWAALRLVFEKVGDSWFLVGIIHDAWTI